MYNIHTPSKMKTCIECSNTYGNDLFRGTSGLICLLCQEKKARMPVFTIPRVKEVYQTEKQMFDAYTYYNRTRFHQPTLYSESDMTVRDFIAQSKLKSAV